MTAALTALAFTLLMIVIGIPGGALMMAGDRRLIDYNVVGADERRRNALPYYVGGTIWIFIVFAFWFISALTWVMS